MTTVTLEAMAQKMRDLDIATLTTVTDGGAIAGRPMSNNGDVAYDGDSYYFTYEASRTVSDIQANPHVGLAFEGADGLSIHVSGKAELIRDKAEFEAHWVDELDHWFDDGIDTPGIVLIKVHAERIKYWQGEDSGEWTA